MGWEYAGQYGLVAGGSWAWLVNFQDMQPWYKRPWLYGSGMLAGYLFCKAATKWQDEALVNQIKKYEARGYVLPEDRKKLFEPRTYT
ncbi:MAG: hypothetical protein WDW38_005229 [Sanguina aurantia]